MRLNMTIINDNLPEMTILHSNIDRSTPRTLRYAAFYNGETALRNDILYIAPAEELVPAPEYNGRPAVICLGYPPVAYNDGFDLLVLSSSTDARPLVSTLNEIFERFNTYDEKLRGANWTDLSSEISALLLEIFGTPVSAYDHYEKILFYAFDKDNPNKIQQRHVAGHYINEQERDVLHADKDFLQSMTTSGVGYRKSPMYDVAIIYRNIMEGSVYLGRVMIEDRYRPFRDSDYALVDWLGDHVRRAIARSAAFHPKQSKDFERMIHVLQEPGAAWFESYSMILEQYRWKQNDTYTCMAVAPAGDSPEDMLAGLNQAAYYLQNLMEDVFIGVQDSHLLVLINSTVGKMDEQLRNSRVRLFLKYNNYAVGISESFDDLANLSRYHRQAQLAVKTACRRPGHPICLFEQEIANIFFLEIQNCIDADAFISNGLSKLMEYDRQTNSDLILTLKTYLENNENINALIEPLHIARTTAVYRLKRIESISGFDLDDSRRSLFLRLLLEIL